MNEVSIFAQRLHSFIYLFSKYLLSSYSALGTNDIEDASKNDTEEVLFLDPI